MLTQDIYDRSFFGAVEALAREKRYNVCWEHGEMVVYPLGDRRWRVAILDDPKNAFVRLMVKIKLSPITVFEKEGYYLPGLSAAGAERIILNCLIEALGYHAKNKTANVEVAC